MLGGLLRRHVLVRTAVGVCVAACLLVPGVAGAAAFHPQRAARSAGVAPDSYGNIDCNGLSSIQHPSRSWLSCADVHDSRSSDGRFYDNGVYIGHDEPDVNYVSPRAGSADDVTWTFRLGADPSASPTERQPGSDISHWFELTPAVWFSMPICDPQSYPLLPCTPDSDANAARGSYPGGGSAFLELQFYPPGFGPWVDAPSFDNTHWGAALTIDSLEGTDNFTNVNFGCPEPVNFSFIQTNGVPPGPPSPQLSDLASDQPNAHTLLMNPGDIIKAHIFDAPVPGGGGHALETVVEDLTTHQTGYMQASAANGFMNTSLIDCSGTPFNFEPEYSTAARGHDTPWAAETAEISAAFETGHFEPCGTVSGKFDVGVPDHLPDADWLNCNGRYENTAPGGDGVGLGETGDSNCYPKGDTHGGLAKNFPDTFTGCLDNLYQNGDLDFDGTPYWTEWPTGSAATSTPGSFLIDPPTTGPQHAQYAAYQFLTDVAFSEESTCNPGTPNGCAAPPPNAPGNFYPFWTLTGSASSCKWEFGDVTSTGNDYGGDSQYGGPSATHFPLLEGAFIPNACTG
jgi:hypothetical protein